MRYLFSVCTLLIYNLISVILESIISDVDQSVGYGFRTILPFSLGLISSTVGITQYCIHRHINTTSNVINTKNHDNNTKHNISVSHKIYTILHYLNYFLVLTVLICNFVSHILCAVSYTNISNNTYSNNKNNHFTTIVTTLVLTGVNIVLTSYVFVCHNIYNDAFKHNIHKLSSTVITITNVFILCSSITLVVITGYTVNKNDINPYIFYTVNHLISMLMATCVACGFLTIYLSNSTNRTSYTKLYAVYSVYSLLNSVICCVTGLVWLITITTGNVTNNNNNNNSHTHWFVINVIYGALLFVCSICLFINSILSPSLRQPPCTDMTVNELDFTRMSDRQIQHYAKLIDKYNTKLYSDWCSGDFAVQLMKAYQSAQIDDTTVKVLALSLNRDPSHTQNKQTNTVDNKHVINNNNNKSSKNQHNVTDNVSKSINIDTTRRGNPSLSVTDPLHTLDDYYIRALYEPPELLQPQTTTATTITDHTDNNMLQQQQQSSSSPSQPLSKNQLAKQQRKLRRKQAKAAAKGQQYVHNVSQPNVESPSSTQQDIVIDVEPLPPCDVLVFMLTNDNYDLTLGLTGWFGKFIRSMFGSNGYIPLLCIRCSYIGFPYPLRVGMFRTSPASYSLITASYRTLVDYNYSLPYNQRSTLLLAPTYTNNKLHQLIKYSGLYNMNIPYTNVIDLRNYVYNNKYTYNADTTLQEYCDSIKYRLRQQNSVFNSHNGICVVKHDINDNDIQDIYRLYTNVSQHQLQMQRHQPIFKPNVSLLHHIAYTLPQRYRSYLSIIVDNTIICTTVLFHIDNKILTTDLQGLDYNYSKKFRAYFVMMSKVVDIALQNKYPIIDCGQVNTYIYIYICIWIIM